MFPDKGIARRPLPVRQEALPRPPYGGAVLFPDDDAPFEIDFEIKPAEKIHSKQPVVIDGLPIDVQNPGLHPLLSMGTDFDEIDRGQFHRYDAPAGRSAGRPVQPPHENPLHRGSKQGRHRGAGVEH